MANFFNFEDLGNGTTLLKFRNESFELDTDKLKKTLAKKPELSKLASKLYIAEDKNLYYQDVYHRALEKEMRQKIDEEIDRLDPEGGWKTRDFLGSRLVMLSYRKATAYYYVYLMAMEYLGILDDFLEDHKEEIKKIYSRGEAGRERYNAKMKYIRSLDAPSARDVMGGW